MHAAVVKLDTLTDAVGAAAQNHDFLLAAIHSRTIVFNLIAGIEVFCIPGAADMHTLPFFHNARLDTRLADCLFLYVQNLRQVFVGESVALCLAQGFSIRNTACQFLDRFFLFNQFPHLLNKVVLHLGLCKNLVVGGTLADRLIHNEVPLTAWAGKHREQLLFGFLFKVFDAAKTVTAGLQRTNRFLERLFVSLADAHHLADRTHLGAQFVLCAFELFKRPACELDDHIVPARHILVKGSILTAGDFIQSQPACQHRGNQRNREAGCLGRQCGRPRGSGVDFNHNNTVRNRVMGKLYIGTADHLNGFYYFICLFLQAFLGFFRNGEHGRTAERVAGVNPEGVDVFNKADGNHVVFGITDNLKFQLFPAEDGFLNQNLSDQRCLQASCTNGLKFFYIIDQTAAGTAHGICRAKHHRIPEPFRNGKGILNRVCNLTARHLDSQRSHGVFKLHTVLTPLNRVYLNTDDLDVVLIQNPRLLKFTAEVESGLSAQIRQKSIWSLFGDNLFQTLHI